jgi:DNA-binding winged helix-turn-helix (wHTH) protein/TolB-like protein
MDWAVSAHARRIELALEPPFDLGGARVDPPSHEIIVDRRSTRMQPQTLKVLVALHDRIGQAVTRDELVDRCWDGRIVGDDVINRCISLLRRFAAASGGFEIETIPRGGYRLVEAERRPRRMISGAVVLLPMTLATLLIAAWALRSPARQGVPPAPVIEVVPLNVLSSDDATRQVAQSAPVSISHMLSESGLPIVLARSAETARSGDFIISGNVRRAGGTVYATIEMNAVRDGTMTFSHDFQAPADKSADLPDQIGGALAANLAWTGAEMLLDRRHPLDPQLASELMKSVTLTIEQGDDLRAYQIARRVAPLAPNSAFAQLALAVDTGFALGAIPRDERAMAVEVGRRASDRARALAPEFGDVYISWCLLHSPVRRVECEARLRSAIRIDPRSSFVPGALSSLLYNAGRIDEAVALARVSLANDPYKPAKMARMIRMLEVTGWLDEAAREFREATRLWPDMPPLRGMRLAGMAERGDYRAIARFTDARADADADDDRAGRAAILALTSARLNRDLPRARHVCDAKGLPALTQSLCMTILADLGDFDRSYAISAVIYPTAVGGGPRPG